jgi:hypothetical protein
MLAQVHKVMRVEAELEESIQVLVEVALLSRDYWRAALMAVVVETE